MSNVDSRIYLDERENLYFGEIFLVDLSDNLTSLQKGNDFPFTDEQASSINVLAERAASFWRVGDKVTAALTIDIAQSFLKFDQHQTRVPIGQHGGGRWTSASSSTSSPQGRDPEHGFSDLRVTAADLDCEVQYKVDSLLCRALKSRACWAQAAQRYAACLAGMQLPPLDF